MKFLFEVMKLVVIATYLLPHYAHPLTERGVLRPDPVLASNESHLVRRWRNSRTSSTRRARSTNDDDDQDSDTSQGNQTNDDDDDDTPTTNSWARRPTTKRSNNDDATADDDDNTTNDTDSEPSIQQLKDDSDDIKVKSENAIKVKSETTTKSTEGNSKDQIGALSERIKKLRKAFQNNSDDNLNRVMKQLNTLEESLEFVGKGISKLEEATKSDTTLKNQLSNLETSTDDLLKRINSINTGSNQPKEKAKLDENQKKELVQVVDALQKKSDELKRREEELNERERRVKGSSQSSTTRTTSSDQNSDDDE